MGRSNQAIADALVVTAGAVEKPRQRDRTVSLISSASRTPQIGTVVMALTFAGSPNVGARSGAPDDREDLEFDVRKATDQVVTPTADATETKRVRALGN
jgi:hypothetical protein